MWWWFPLYRWVRLVPGRLVSMLSLQRLQWRVFGRLVLLLLVLLLGCSDAGPHAGPHTVPHTSSHTGPHTGSSHPGANAVAHTEPNSVAHAPAVRSAHAAHPSAHIPDPGPIDAVAHCTAVTAAQRQPFCHTDRRADGVPDCPADRIADTSTDCAHGCSVCRPHDRPNSAAVTHPDSGTK
jgi:hypothetical protein